MIDVIDHTSYSTVGVYLGLQTSSRTWYLSVFSGTNRHPTHMSNENPRKRLLSNTSTDGNEDFKRLETECARLQHELDRVSRAKNTLLEENKQLDKLRCSICNDASKNTDLIHCKRDACGKVACRECLDEQIGCYHHANVGQEIFSCHSCAHSYDRTDLAKVAGSNYLKAVIFFATQAVVQRERSRVNKFENMDSSELHELTTLVLPCCKQTPIVDFDACCVIGCSLCKHSTCAWCFQHFAPDQLGNYTAHEHVRHCPDNPNTDCYYVGNHQRALTRAFQSHQARQMCEKLKVTLIGDTQNGAQAVHN